MLKSNNSSKDSILSVENLTVSFDGYKVVDGLSLSIEEKRTSGDNWSKRSWQNHCSRSN